MGNTSDLNRSKKITDAKFYGNRRAIPYILLTALLVACSGTSLPPEPDLSKVKYNNGETSIQQDSNFLDNSGTLSIEVTLLDNSRTRAMVDDAIRTVTSMYQQCQIPLQATVNELNNENALSINVEERYRLTHQYTTKKPSIFIVKSTAEQDVAFSYLPSLRRDVSGTAWITQRVSEPCFAWVIAHEIGHLLLNDGSHHPQKNNIMHAQCSLGNNFNASSSQPGWTKKQCEIMRSNR